MATGVMARSDAAHAIEVLNVRETLPFAKPKLHYPQFGQPDTLMKRKSDHAYWIKFDKLAVPSSVLADNPTWTPVKVTDTQVDAQLEMWGNGIEITEFLKETSFLDLPAEYKKLLGQNAGETINEKVRDVLKVGTNVGYAGDATERAELTTGDIITFDGVIDQITEMEADDVAMYTGKGGEFYPVFISPRSKGKLMKDDDFKAAVYNQKDSLFTGELTTINGGKFMVTSTAPVLTNSGSNSTVAYLEQTIIVGDGGYGIARLLPGDFQVIITEPGGHGDEYKVKTALAWKCYLKAVILNADAVRRYEHSRT